MTRHASSVSITINLPWPRRRVWSRITEPALVREWLSDDAAFTLAVGTMGTLTWHEFGAFRIAIENVTDGAVFGFRLAREVDVDPRDSPSTQVRFTLDDTGDGGTRLTVSESGWESLAGVDPTEAMAENRSAWEAELQELVRHLETPDIP